MRFSSYLALSVLTGMLTYAAETTPDVSRAATAYNAPRSKVSMYIWSDKYVYQAGQSLTLKWTVKTNGDLYPYTVFAYRQNNQTGVKTYLPANNTTVTDLQGNNVTGGFQPVSMSDASKATLIGNGGRFPAITIPDELGMHTIAVELRDYASPAPPRRRQPTSPGDPISDSL